MISPIRGDRDCVIVFGPEWKAYHRRHPEWENDAASHLSSSPSLSRRVQDANTGCWMLVDELRQGWMSE